MSEATQAVLNKARQDKFLLYIALPEPLLSINKKLPKSAGKLSLDSLQFSVFGAIVPKIEIPDQALPHYGQTMKMSSHTRAPYEPLTIKFKIDNKFWNYWVLHHWLNLLNDADTGKWDTDDLVKKDRNQPPAREDLKHYESNVIKGKGDPEYIKQYSANMSLWGLDEYENKAIEFKYTGAFPTSIDGITYDYQQTDEITSSATFSFSQFRAQLI